MRFRKNGIMFWEHQILYLVFCIASAVMALVMKWHVLLLPAALFAALALFNPIMNADFIIIDDAGIKCERKGNVLWAHKWSDIHELRKIALYRNPGCQIVLQSEAGPERTQCCFQLGVSVRKALKKYYCAGCGRI